MSSTLKDPQWRNSTVPNGDVINEVSKLKQELNDLVLGSFQLLRALIKHDLVDELRAEDLPRPARGGGAPLRQATAKQSMRLVDAQTLDGDVAFLTYKPVRDPASLL